ncbi:hypothetical protein SRABI134_01816 [Peribacillus sp. Bi134]|nr:hypothetical protein SRABI134_01816 [Peribacillus sp. Bi134]
METELLKVFDSNRIQRREVVHRLGYWPAGSQVVKRDWITIMKAPLD